MTKKQLFLLSLAGVTLCALANKKKKKYSNEELTKIKKYQEYLQNKDFVVLTKKEYKKRKGSSIFSLAALPNYYSIAKQVSRYVL